MNDKQKQTIAKLKSVKEDMFVDGSFNSVNFDKPIYQSQDTFALFAIGEDGEPTILKCGGFYKKNWYIVKFIKVNIEDIDKMFRFEKFL